MEKVGRLTIKELGKLNFIFFEIDFYRGHD